MNFDITYVGFLRDFFDVINILGSGLLSAAGLVLDFLSFRLSDLTTDFPFLQSIVDFILGDVADLSIGTFFIGSGVFIYLTIRIVKFLIGIFT